MAPLRLLKRETNNAWILLKQFLESVPSRHPHLQPAKHLAFQLLKASRLSCSQVYSGQFLHKHLKTLKAGPSSLEVSKLGVDHREFDQYQLEMLYFRSGTSESSHKLKQHRFQTYTLASVHPKTLQP